MRTSLLVLLSLLLIGCGVMGGTEGGSVSVSGGWEQIGLDGGDERQNVCRDE